MPTNGQPEQSHEMPPWAKALKPVRPEDVKTPEPAPRTEPVHDFLSRIDDASQLLADVGRELGAVGQDDLDALKTFSTTMRENTRRYIGALIERKRRELNDLERILGKF